MTHKPNYNYLYSLLSILTYKKVSEKKRKKVVNKRLNRLVNYAKERSAYFEKAYSNIDTKSVNLNNLTNLPVTCKVELEKEFDSWITIPELKKSEIDIYLMSEDNFRKRYLNKYLLFQTSGTTGAPVTVINGSNELAVTLSIGLLRTYYHITDVLGLMVKGIRKKCIAACILPVKTPCISTYLTQEAAVNPINKRRRGSKIVVIDIEKSMPEIVKELNELQPLSIAGFVTFVEMLCDEADKGNLHICPKYISTVGEKLTQEVQARIEKTFGGKSIMSYACTECAEIAHRCEKDHFHINDDWIIVEPVDENNNAVDDGVVSHKILVTNLWNYTQPFIRYEINDRCIMHHEQCACGDKSPWIEVEGRSHKPLIFQDDSLNEVKITPVSIGLTMHKDDVGVKKSQFVLHKDFIEIRVSAVDGFDRAEVFERIKREISSFLAERNITSYNIVLSEENPRIEKSGKFRQVYQEGWE